MGRPLGRKAVVSVTRPSYGGKGKVLPKRLWSKDLPLLVGGSRGPLAQSVQPFRFAERGKTQRRLRIDVDEVPFRDGDTEQRLVDAVPDHPFDEGEILLERLFVDLEAVVLHLLTEVRDHLVVDDEIGL